MEEGSCFRSVLFNERERRDKREEDLGLCVDVVPHEWVGARDGAMRDASGAERRHRGVGVRWCGLVVWSGLGNANWIMWAELAGVVVTS